MPSGTIPKEKLRAMAIARMCADLEEKDHNVPIEEWAAFLRHNHPPRPGRPGLPATADRPAVPPSPPRPGEYDELPPPSYKSFVVRKEAKIEVLHSRAMRHESLFRPDDSPLEDEQKVSQEIANCRNGRHVFGLFRRG